MVSEKEQAAAHREDDVSSDMLIGDSGDDVNDRVAQVAKEFGSESN